MIQIVRFLLLGGLAAAINWVARFPLSMAMPFPAAVFVAYMIGMSAGFVLYRRYVFPGSHLPIGTQIGLFLGVNAVGAVVVMGCALALLHGVLPAIGWTSYPEAIAHGLAIGIGAVVNFIGHKFLTFRVRRSSTAPATPS
ncbi:GtrA family protein [Pelagibacterium montanilacus]|uniref:GtrA family protein n=1 Tax=Pelagibacterium montanilacus TaxID=2185280 RepID=UPI001FEC328C|nr:GtrA family protein [Pelagibacterium montanilacus]